MNIKYWILVGILILGIVFLVMDKCGDNARLIQLKKEYETHKTITKIIVTEAKKFIIEQDKKIKGLDERVEFLNGIIEVKDEDLAELDNKVTDLEDEFGNLKDKDAKIDNLTKQVNLWKEKFTLSQSIIKNKDEIIFSLTEKYEIQVKISSEYKKMYESTVLDNDALEKVVKAQDWQIKKLKLTSGVKTGIVITMAVVVAYSLLKD